MTVSKRLRFEILRRDDYRCRYCGATAAQAPLRVDHVTPVVLGGTDEKANLVTACEPCNSGKTSTAPDPALLSALAETAPFMATTAIKRCVWSLLADFAPADLVRLARADDEVTCLNALGIWSAAWGGRPDVEPPALAFAEFRGSLAQTVHDGCSAPVLHGAAHLAGHDSATEVGPYARAISEALTAELRGAPSAPATQA